LQTVSELLKIIEYKEEITVTQMLREKSGGVLEGKNFNFIADTIIVKALLNFFSVKAKFIIF